MTENMDIRWKQRFENFDRAYTKFKMALEYHLKEPDHELFQLALIQTFEFTFELGWKTVKDYLSYSGISKVTLPREVIKHGFQNRIIDDGQMWIDMMQDKNLMAHTYSEENAKKALGKITDSYHAGIEQLHSFFKEKVAEV
jgi:nucleotidyltransferase substrate binding protein (TIGR01987 family)